MVSSHYIIILASLKQTPFFIRCPPTSRQLNAHLLSVQSFWLLPSRARGGTRAVRQMDLAGLQSLWRHLPHSLPLPELSQYTSKLIPILLAQRKHTHYSRKRTNLDLLRGAQRVCGSQENQQGCPYILLLSLGQRVHIVIFLLLCAVPFLHVYSHAQCGGLYL